jgi:hypothetical protein
MFIPSREFLKDGRMTGAFQNPVSPDVPTHQGDRIGEGQRLFDAPRPADSRFPAFVLRLFREPQCHQRVETKQARLGTQNRPRAASTRCFEADVFASFLEGHFDRPAAGVGFDDLLRRQIDVCREEVFVAMSARQVFDEDPADGNQSLAPPCTSAPFP